MIFCYLLPQLYNGAGGFGASALTIVLSCMVSGFCISGLARKTVFNIISSIVGGLLVACSFRFLPQFCSWTDAAWRRENLWC